MIEKLQQDEDRYQLPTYAKFPFFIEKGEGCYVFDQEGNKYLDLYGAHAVASTGHCHPHVVEAIQQQAAKLIFYSNVSYNSARARAVSKLVTLAGQPYYQAFLVNSGSEANDNAIKLARAVTGRREIISLAGSFHGRTYGSLSATGIPKYADYLNTPVPRHRVLPPEAVAEAVSEETAAALIEPIQSMGGVQEIPPDRLRQIQQACQSHGALMIFDEVQTGLARTGSFLYSGHEGIYPEMVSLAKGIASGIPAGALLLTQEVAKTVKSGDLGSTFGGGPLSCAAMEATLDVIEKENLVENAARMGAYLKEGLSTISIIEKVLGKGLLLGLKLAQGMKAKELQSALLKKRVLAGTSMDAQVLRLMPPLTLSPREADLFVEAVKTI
ncbi:aminotransferase class III-fold pyridoxal phosphate-dependent enzyme [Acidobacteria bacterium AH-259-D05]|nr:aminotransferase class III-fold pyridoxal phosphate-dependent enzyme [Acidobacteria bacterium AH-259-D05]